MSVVRRLLSAFESPLVAVQRMPMKNTGTIDAALRILFDKNVRYATVIDLGSADGHFFLGHLGDGMFAGAVGVNVDANPLYEPSLRAIADTLGRSAQAS